MRLQSISAKYHAKYRENKLRGELNAAAAAAAAAVTEFVT